MKIEKPPEKKSENLTCVTSLSDDFDDGNKFHV